MTWAAAPARFAPRLAVWHLSHDLSPPSPLLSAAQKLKLEIVDPPRRKHAVFEGASVLGSIYATNDSYWFSKAQYAEEGAARLAGKVRSLVGSGH